MTDRRTGVFAAAGRVASMVATASPRLTTKIVIWQVAGAAATVVQLLSLRHLIGSMERGADGVVAEVDFSGLIPVFAALSVATVLAALSAALIRELRQLLAEDVSRSLRMELVTLIGRAEQRHLDDPALHDRLRLVHDSLGQRIESVPWALVSAGMGGLGILAIGAVLIRIAPIVLVVVGISSLPLLAVSHFKSRILFAFQYDETPADRRRVYLEAMHYDRRSAAELIAHVVRPELRRRVGDLFDERRDRLHQLYRRRWPAVLGSTVVAVAGLAVAMAGLLVLISRGSLSLPDAAVAALALNQLRGRITTFTIGLEEIQQAGPLLGLVDELRAELPEPATPAQIAVPRFQQLRFDRVGFTYPGADRAALTDVTFTLRRGSVMALVGENGSGKTTLAKLVAGLYQPTEGRLCWNDTPFGDVVSTGQPFVAQLFQDFNRYELSVLDNITLGDPEKPPCRDKAMRAAEAAGAHDWIERLPQGYETIVSRSFADGTELSGGQWQRLALARTIYRQGTIVILDEPTAAQDPLREADFLLKMRRVLGDATVLLISHRLSAVRQADVIGVLHRGRLVECGTHDALMVAGGRYFAMFTSQADRYAEGHTGGKN